MVDPKEEQGGEPRVIDHRLTGLGLSEGFDGWDGARGGDFAAETEIPPIVVWGDGEEEGEDEENEEGEGEPEEVFAFVHG